MYTYRMYEKKRHELLERARRAGIPAPARRWPKLGRAALENRGEAADYWDQVADILDAVDAATAAAADRAAYRN